MQTAVDEIKAEIARYAEAQDNQQALIRLRALWDLKPGPSTASFILRHLDRIKPNATSHPQKIAILRSFTLEPIESLFRGSCFAYGFDVSVRLGDFNSYNQEILGPQSFIYDSWSPNIVILAVQLRDIAPAIWNGAVSDSTSMQAAADDVVRHMAGLIKTFRERSGASLIVHNFETPPYPSAGLLDAVGEGGQTATVRRINSELQAIARQYPGVYVLDYDGLVARCGRDTWYDEQWWTTARLPIRREWHYRLANEWMRFLHPLTGRISKAIILDLDNTLWGGIIGEDGQEGIKLGDDHPGSAYRDFQRALLHCHDRGILLSICSKNNYDDAINVIDKHPAMLLKSHHFAAMRINWQNKAENIRSIAKELNIGTDSLVFFDDNPVECELVQKELPEVCVISLPPDPDRYVAILRDVPSLERLSVSQEDRQRGQFYIEQRQRTDLERSMGSTEEFLASLNMKVGITPVNAQTLPRAAQLTQKTNQFNVTTRRYTEQDLEAKVRSGDWFVLTVRAADKFGDHGIVGLVIINQAASAGAWEIDTFLLSCRVIGRTIETAILSHVARLAKASNVTLLLGTFLPTKKNEPASRLFADHGFAMTKNDDVSTHWRLDLRESNVEVPTWIELEESAG